MFSLRTLATLVVVAPLAFLACYVIIVAMSFLGS